MLYAVIAFLATAAWIPLFMHLRRHPDLLKEATAPDRFAGEVIRPAIGIAGYIVAVACGWLIYPLTGVAIFILIVAYYADTSTGIRTHPLQTECTPTDDNTEAPTADDRSSAVT